MAVKLFNALCDRCKTLKPRCALCIFGGDRDEMSRHNDDYRTFWQETLCPDCRKVLRGKFRLDEKHREKA